MACKILIVGGEGTWGKKYCKTLNDFFPDVHYNVIGRDGWYMEIEKKYDGVIIATPPSPHIEIASEALLMNVPVLIEKPLALSLKDCKRLQMLSKIADTPIFVNHLHLFSHSFRRLKARIEGKVIERIETYGCGNGPVRDWKVPHASLWDYGCHDVAMIVKAVGRPPESIKAKATDPSSINDIISSHPMEMFSRSLYRLEMNFGSFRSMSVVGNDSLGKMRLMSVKTKEGWQTMVDEEKDPPPLLCSISAFLRGIDGRKEENEGLSLPLQVTAVLDGAVESIKRKMNGKEEEVSLGYMMRDL